jgi:hypothetical protein
MSQPNGDKPPNERFLDALVEELQTMSDTEALEGEDAEGLVKLGERLLKQAREGAGKRRMTEAKRKLSTSSERRPLAAHPSVAEARRYLESRPELTLAARNLNELSDADVLDLFSQVKSLEEAAGTDAEDSK